MPKAPLNIVSCMIFDDQNRLLLLRRHSDDLGGKLWAAPGGTQEQGEAPSDTVIREVKEETDLDLDSVTYLGSHEVRMPHGVVRMQTYRTLVNGAEGILIDPEEHDAYRWFDLAELLDAENIIWGLPTTLFDFGFVESLDVDPTLADGSEIVLLDSVSKS